MPSKAPSAEPSVSRLLLNTRNSMETYSSSRSSWMLSMRRPPLHKLSSDLAGQQVTSVAKTKLKSLTSGSIAAVAAVGGCGLTRAKPIIDAIGRRGGSPYACTDSRIGPVYPSRSTGLNSLVSLFHAPELVICGGNKSPFPRKLNCSLSREPRRDGDSQKEPGGRKHPYDMCIEFLDQVSRVDSLTVVVYLDGPSRCEMAAIAARGSNWPTTVRRTAVEEQTTELKNREVVFPGGLLLHAESFLKSSGGNVENKKSEWLRGVNEDAESWSVPSDHRGDTRASVAFIRPFDTLRPGFASFFRHGLPGGENLHA
ncbi:hypothetical protein EYF80_033527 [Liparis tanakae]|uniref:Uncharacterized protein n=1 Tax=Liparis tanakae TaxID=230148 RepID=A0A4Z2GUF8_9TELE|nr:hypothetical protein EYF80_033527 [Liparis tanakae]